MYQFLALTSPGIEILMAQELKDLGAEQVVQKPEGVYFEASLEQAYHIVLWTRLATRVLAKIGEGPAQDKQALFTSALAIDWQSHFGAHNTFAIDFVGTNRELRNSQFGALTVKDAIVDYFVDRGDSRPNVDKHEPEIRIQARLLKQQVTFFVDFSGRSLFQRGYRFKTGAAPLKENLAAAIILRSGWLEDTSLPLLDPMCGSGTIIIEAASMALRQAPGLNRMFWGLIVGSTIKKILGKRYVTKLSNKAKIMAKKSLSLFMAVIQTRAF